MGMSAGHLPAEQQDQCTPCSPSSVGDKNTPGIVSQSSVIPAEERPISMADARGSECDDTRLRGGKR